MYNHLYTLNGDLLRPALTGTNFHQQICQPRKRNRLQCITHVQVSHLHAICDSTHSLTTASTINYSKQVRGIWGLRTFVFFGIVSLFTTPFRVQNQCSIIYANMHSCPLLVANSWTSSIDCKHVNAKTIALHFSYVALLSAQFICVRLTGSRDSRFAWAKSCAGGGIKKLSPLHRGLRDPLSCN